MLETSYFGFTAHPFSFEFPYDGEWECWGTQNWDTAGLSAIEIWNYGSNIDDPSTTTRAVQKWKDLLLQGKRVVAVGNSDAHSLDNIGRVFNNVWVDSFDRSGLVAALKRGSLYVSNHAALTIGTNLSMMGGEGKITAGQSIIVSGYFSSYYPGTVEVYKGVIGDSSETIVWSGIPNPYYSFTDYPSSKTYYRAEFHSYDSNYHAFTNPVWVNVVAQTLYTEKNIKENEEGMRGVRK